MNIDSFQEDIKKCRFCFMCRHLSGVGNVTFREADTPRIRTAMVYGVQLDNSKLANADFIDTVYSSDLSAACRYHCVNHFDENGIMLAARRDIVESGLVPDDVNAIAKKLVAENPAPKISGAGDVLYYIDADTAAVASEARAFDKIAKKAGIKYRAAKGGNTGKALYVLGFAEAAKLSAEAFAEAVNKSGVKTVVVSSPAAYDALANDFKSWGIKLSAKVVHASEFIASLRLKFSKNPGRLCYLESDFLKNYNGNLKFPRMLLGQLKAESAEGFATDLTAEKTPFMFGTNNEESYTCGEGAVVFAQLRPEIAKKMAKYVEARADRDCRIAVASPYTKAQLDKNTKLKVSTLTEIAAECL